MWVTVVWFAFCCNTREFVKVKDDCDSNHYADKWQAFYVVWVIIEILEGLWKKRLILMLTIRNYALVDFFLSVFIWSLFRYGITFVNYIISMRIHWIQLLVHLHLCVIMKYHDCQLFFHGSYLYSLVASWNLFIIIDLALFFFYCTLPSSRWETQALGRQGACCNQDNRAEDHRWYSVAFYRSD